MVIPVVFCCKRMGPVALLPKGAMQALKKRGYGRFEMQNDFVYPNFRWFIMLTVAFGYCVIGVLLIAPATIVGIIAKEMSITVGQASMITMGTYTLAAAVAAILSGIFIDRFGVPKTITAGSIIVVLAVLATPFVGHTAGGLAITRIFVGLGGAPIAACCATVAARWFPEHERAIFAGIQGAGASIGIALGFVIVPQIMKAANGNWLFTLGWLSIGPIVTLILCIVTIFVPEPKFHLADQTDSDSGPLGNVFGLSVRQSAFYIGIACFGAFCWIMNAFNDLTPGYIAVAPPTGLGFGPTVAGQSMMFVQIGMIIGSFATGFIFQKIFKGKTKPVLATGFMAAAICMLSVKFEAVYANKGVLITALFFAGFFQAFIIPVMAAFIARHYPASVSGRVYGISLGTSFIGSALGVFVGSTFLHFTGNYQASILAVSIVAVLGFLAALSLNPPKISRSIDDLALADNIR